MTGNISSYGGDALIVATRGEIDRVIAELTSLDAWLRSQVELEDFVTDPVRRVRLGLELPPLLDRISRVRDACAYAADAYFGTEVEISRELREAENLDVQNMATGFAGVGSMFGILSETGVAANLVSVRDAVLPPTSIGSLVERLEATAALGPAWLRIEKFREPASPVSAANGLVAVSEARYVVYIPGTQSWGPKPGQNPLDLTSNLSAISKTGFAGSERAVALAMKQAGINSTDKVLLVGHSQGGMVAANLSTRFPASKVLTFGAPLGQLTDRFSVQGLTVEHVGDPVPKLDANPNPLKANWVTVRQEIDGYNPLSQHELKGYVETAKAIDSSAPSGPNCAADELALNQERNLVKIRNEISGFAGKAAGQELFFELTRLP